MRVPYSIIFSLAMAWGIAHAEAPIDEEKTKDSPHPADLLQPVFKESLSWDSNPLMLSTGTKPLRGSLTSVGLLWDNVTPLSELHMNTTVNENIYDQSDFNSTDLHEKFSIGRHNERWSVSLGGLADYNTTRSSELTNFNLNLPNVRHLGLDVTPEISYRTSATDEVNLAGGVTRSTYDNKAFSDYEVYSATSAWKHEFDQLNTGTISVHAQRYQGLQSPSQRTDSYGPSAGWLVKLTPRFVAKLSGGYEKATQYGIGAIPTTSQWNYTFSGEVAFKGLQDESKFNATRAQFPFSNGSELLLTSISLNENHAINSLLSVNLSGNYQYTDHTPPSSGTNLKSQYGAGTGMDYHVLESTDLSWNYQYRNEKLTGLNDAIEEHMVLLSITYHPFAETQPF